MTNAFEKVFGSNFKRIMCWAHAERAMKKKLLFIKDKELYEQLVKDLYSLQSSFSQSKFDIGYKLFREKWEKVEGMTKYFDDYFEDEWINSSNQGWFEGLAPGYPSTNNGLESTNNVIKTIHTLKERVPLSQFLERLKIILNRWSVDRVERVRFQYEPRLTDELWKSTLDYVV